MPLSKRILVIGYVWPEPNSSAAGSHIESLLNFFIEQSCNVIFASPAQKTERSLDLATLGVASADIALNCSSFDNFVAQLSPDIVLFDRFMMEEQFGWRVEKVCPDALKILDTEDLFCLRHARHNRFKLDGKINPPIVEELFTSDIAKREIAAILRCDLSLIISEFERAVLLDHFNIDSSLLVYTPFLLDPICEKQAESWKSFDERQHFISIGNFRHPPNWDSTLFLKQTVWPLIRKQLPDAELHIYGAYTPPKAQALNQPKDGFMVKGWAENADCVMAQARVNLALVRFGAGLKGKLIDAMRNGTPSVASSIGAEAIAGELPFCGFVSDDPEMIANYAVNLYRNQTQWLLSRERGKQIYNARFNKAEHCFVLKLAIEQCLEDLPSHRRRNFIGAMLKHHTMKSTQYMSQWIELKTQIESN